MEFKIKSGYGSTTEKLKCLICKKSVSDYISYEISEINIEIPMCSRCKFDKYKVIKLLLDFVYQLSKKDEKII